MSFFRWLFGPVEFGEVVPEQAESEQPDPPVCKPPPYEKLSAVAYAETIARYEATAADRKAIVEAPDMTPIVIPPQPKLDEHDYAVLLRMVDELRKRMSESNAAMQRATSEFNAARAKLDSAADWLNKLDTLMTKIAANIGNLDLHEDDER